MAILAFGTIAIYSRTFSVPFLYDDLWSIVGNLSIRQLWPVWSALEPPDQAGVGGRPLLNLSFALNYAAGGDSVFGYHLVNLAIHVIAGCVLFALVRRTLESPRLAERFGRSSAYLALAISAIWAWHPLQTISVTYISQRAESLMALFYLLTLYCFVRGASQGKIGRRWQWFAFSILACVAGAATKEVIATAPVVALLYDRCFISGGFRAAWRRNWPCYVALLIALFPVGRRIMFLQHGGVVSGVGFGGGITWWNYALTESRVILRYLSLAFWPRPLVFDYGRCVPCRLSEVWPYTVVLMALLSFSVAALRRAPALGFAACWFFLILAPTSSIIPVVGQSMAENRVYLPLAGVVAATVLAAFTFIGRASFLVFALVAGVLGAASFERNGAFTSEVNIWSDTVSNDPTNARGHGNLGKALARSPGHLGEAVAEYSEAARLDPSASEVHVNLGNLWFRVPGRLGDAIAEYRKALELQPDDPDAHYDLACGLARLPDGLNAALEQYEDALRLRPDFPAAHVNLGNALLRIPGRTEDAIAHFDEAIRLKPDMAEAHLALALALIDEGGRDEDARMHLRKVLKVQPGNDEARRMLEHFPPTSP